MVYMLLNVVLHSFNFHKQFPCFHTVSIIILHTSLCYWTKVVEHLFMLFPFLFLACLFKKPRLSPQHSKENTLDMGREDAKAIFSF